MATPAPTAPGSPPALPTSSDAESTFDTLWDGFNSWLKNNLWPYLGAVATSTAANAAEAEAAAIAATAYAVSAQTAASTAAGAANFKGEWSSLTGALALPACVKHIGRFWLLLSDLVNVATATPGVSAAWTPMDVGTAPTQLITSGGSVSAVVGVRYLVAANGVTLTVPAAPIKGDIHGVTVMSGVTGFVWAFGAAKLRGASPGSMAWDVGAKGIDLVFEDATRGYV